MQVEIWSDVVCPFCYIGKRKFERALAKFEANAAVTITWRSFQLNPEEESNSGKTVYQSLAERKGITEDQARQMSAQVTAMAKEEGLNFDFDRAIPANTLNAHRLMHLAAKHSRQDQAEELLFKAYFEQGLNVADPEVLTQLGRELSLPQEEVQKLFTTDELRYEVKSDIQDAQNLGVRGVPFFVLNRKYAISGAQPTEVMLQALQQAFQEELVDSKPEE